MMRPREFWDDDDIREARAERLAAARRNFCLCGYPDWPGQCPGPANCPVHGIEEGDREQPEDLQ